MRAERPWEVKLAVWWFDFISRRVCPGCGDGDQSYYAFGPKDIRCVPVIDGKRGKRLHRPKNGRWFRCRAPVKHRNIGEIWSMEFRARRFRERSKRGALAFLSRMAVAR